MEKESDSKAQNNQRSDITTQKRSTKVFSVFAIVVFLLAVMFLITYIIVVLSLSGDYFGEFSERSASIFFEEDIEKTNALAQVHYENLYEVAERLKYAESKEKVEDIMLSYIGSAQFGDLRYYSQGKAYTAGSSELETENSGHELISALSQSREAGCTEPYFDEALGFDCMAFFVPIRGSAYVDGVLSILPARDIISMESILRDNSDVVILMDKSGKMISAKVSADFAESNNIENNFFSFIAKLASTKENVHEIESTVRLNKKATCTLDTVRGSYTVSVSPVESFDGKMLLVSLCESEGLITPELIYVRHVANISIIAIVFLIIGSVCALFYYRKTQSALTSASYTDHAIGCANAEQFKNTAGSTLKESNQSYAVAVFEIRQFRYISEKLSEGDVNDLLKYIAKVIESLCDARETYGYLGEGRFALLIRYSSERSIRDRARLIEAVSNKHAVFGVSKSKRNFNVGACIAYGTKKSSMQELINYATIACEKAKNDINLPFVVYNEKLNKERAHNDRIEAEMESALANNEFRLFLQPKYNVAGDRIDSAEALVRWFDTKTGDYRFPGEFIGLFETNGFITKLDHFMYIEALKYLSQAAERGEKVVPISVNVSLVTVSADNFLDFYIENKKKYQVGDNFIIIEFTESFAMGDHQKIREMVDTLHANGIRCSLDDFGSGYSSLGVIKNVPFDEVKFDRMFLLDGFDKKHDATMLKTMFELANSLGMRVVQEGVETKEMFDRVVAMGCDVIQGYYYAKAIPVEEYKLFVNTNTSIKYKSRVK